MQHLTTTPRDLTTAVRLLHSGAVIVFPTDTSYGLGGLFNSKKVTAAILKIKGRKDEKFSLIAGSLAQVERFFSLSPAQKKLARQYWPGPLSIVVDRRFSVRVPANGIARSLARRVGKPLIATSANLTGQSALYDSKKIMTLFVNRRYQPAAIIDDGRLPRRRPSTVVVVSNGKLTVVRRGAITI